MALVPLLSFPQDMQGARVYDDGVLAMLPSNVAANDR